MQVFTTSDITNLYGFTQRQLDSWDRGRFISPSTRAANGKGTIRLYSLDDLLAFRFVKRLQNSGWHIRTIKTAVHNLREILPDKDPLRDLVLLNANGTILARCSSEDGQTILLDALSSGQMVMAFSLSGLLSQVALDLRALEQEV